ncbi:hypothetical protein [Fibrobacter sp.]|uniref:hypothetical protein n=1 Tax=Fibrobacter sp. TaxID=35828 RepID=UPI00388F361D
MHNGEYQIDRYIKEMEDEVLALKTAHQRPLGTLDFFKKSLSFTVNLSESYGVYAVDFIVVVKIATPTTKPPIVQCGWSTPTGFLKVDFLDFSVSSDYETYSYKLELLTSQTIDSANMNFTALSSQPIISVNWSYS